MSAIEVTLTEAAARILTDEVKADAAALWSKLLRLYEGGAHLALGYSSWGAYYAAEFDGSSNYGYRLLKSAEVMEQLPIGNSRPSSEAVARELVPVLKADPKKVEEVWGEVVEEHGPAPTAKQVREHVTRKVRKPITDGVTSTTLALGRVIDRLGRFADDDRFTSNREQIATAHLSDWERARDQLQHLIELLEKE